MPQEHVFSDFSGGMNAISPVDKLDPKECLAAFNVRLDATGSILSAGALTRQNLSPYAAAAGTNSTYVHSMFYEPALGAVAGVGQDVFAGPTLGGMAGKLTAVNPSQQKMSFGASPSRVYFDVGMKGYWTDQARLLTVDWPPPMAAGSITTGPTTVGTSIDSPFFSFSPAWTNPGNGTSTTSASTASVTVTGGSAFESDYLRCTMTTNSFAVSTAAITGIGVTFQANSSVAQGPQIAFLVTLIRNGVPIGDQKTFSPSVAGVYTPVVLGNSNDPWGVNWSQADINSGTFGVQITYGCGLSVSSATCNLYDVQLTIYQGAGFTVAAGTTGVLTGTYSYKITFVAQNGEESDASGESNTATFTSQQGTITAIATGDSRTVARNIYRFGNTLTSHYLVGTIQDNSSTTYSDNQTDLAALTEAVILSGDVPGDYPNSRLGSTQVRFPVYHYDRVFWINENQPNQLIWSKPLNGFAYPVINAIDVGDATPIARHVSIFGELIIVKGNGQIWRLTGTDESSFDLSQTPSNVGTDLPFTIAVLPDKLPFVNRYGMWVFNGYTSSPLTNKLDLWFKQLDRSTVSIFSATGFHPPAVASNALAPPNFEAVANSEKYVWAYAETGQAINNAILVFDIKHGNITKRIVPSNPLSLAIDPTTGFVYVGDTLGYVSLLDDWNGATQGGSAATFEYQHGYQDVARGSNKVLWAFEFFLNTNGQTLTPFAYYDNGAFGELLPTISTSSLQRVVRRVTNTASRNLQNFSWRLNGSINPINVSGTPQIEIVHVKALYDVRTGRARTGQ